MMKRLAYFYKKARKNEKSFQKGVDKKRKG